MKIKEIIQAKNKLPLDFINDIYNTYTEKVADKILYGMTKKRLTTLRVNTLKSNIDEIKKYLKDKNIEFENVYFYNDALIIKNEDEKYLRNLEIYKNGYIYIQSLSSMIPALVLNPTKKDKVLDLTAAPGSKTMQMAALMKNEGLILANEVDKIRLERLKYNIKMQGVKIAEVVNEDGRNIGKKYPCYFDKVLLDTPCSGEGRFLVTDEKTYKFWSNKEIEKLQTIQKELLKSASQALKEKGEIVYSTCTLNTKENEEIINWAIKNLRLEVIDIDLNLKDKISIYTKGLDKSVKKALKILPNKIQEGFFIAKLKKKSKEE